MYVYILYQGQLSDPTNHCCDYWNSFFINQIMDNEFITLLLL